jgi:hypothetical protein
MTVKSRFGLSRLAIAFVEALLLALALHFVAHFFGWHLFSEAGGGVARSDSMGRPAV